MNKSESKYFNTAKKMDDALLSLLEEKTFEYITVSEVCKKAKVNRSTFYLHYENTADLLAEAARSILNDFTACFNINTKNIAEKFKNCPLEELNFITDEYLHPYLLYIKNNRRVFSTVLMHIHSLGYYDVFKRLHEHVFDPILARFNYPPAYRQYVMMFYLQGVNAIVTEWLKNDCSENVEEISKIIENCIFGLKDPSL